jgi:putative endonuclease
MERISTYCTARMGAYYTGTARIGLDNRVGEHNSGHYDRYTATRRPVTLVFSQWFDRITDAIAAERQVKGWSRKKKEALIRGDFASLRVLSRRRPHPSRYVERPLMIRSLRPVDSWRGFAQHDPSVRSLKEPWSSRRPIRALSIAASRSVALVERGAASILRDGRYAPSSG